MENNEDLEDGEIEDDEEEVVAEAAPVKPETSETTDNDLEALAKSDQDLRLLNPIPPVQPNRNRHHKHDKKKRTATDTEDDWAGNVEKAIAQIINKDTKDDEDGYESDDKRRGKKRRRDRDRDRKSKKRRSPPEPALDLPRFPSHPDDEIDEDEMICIRGGGSPKQPPVIEPPMMESIYAMDDPSLFGGFGPNDPYDSQSSEYDSDYHDSRNSKRQFSKEKESSSKKRRNQRRKMKAAKNKEKRKDEQKVLQDSNSVCTFYMQGNCQKHIESAPKEILGDFPKLTREGAAILVNATQKKIAFDLNPPIEVKKEQPCSIKTENKRSRNRPSRWGSEKEQIDISQIVRKLQTNLAADSNILQSVFDTLSTHDQKRIQIYNMMSYEKDQDMRVVSNGDIDMRVPPPESLAPPEPLKDQDMRVLPPVIPPPVVLPAGTVVVPPAETLTSIKEEDRDDRDDTEEERDLEIDEPESADDLPENLPSKQRELFMRIKAQQKENVVQASPGSDDDPGVKDDDWYSDDDDDDIPLKTTTGSTEESKPATQSPPAIEPLTLPSSTPNLPDFSKVDISAQVTKLLSLVKTQAIQVPTNLDPTTIASLTKTPPPVTTPVDPRQKARPDPRKEPAKDPRTKRNSIDTKTDKLTIYELGALDTDLRTRTDTDLRGLPFKPIENYIPATEINASISSHLPIPYRVHLCEIPRPDYSGLRLSAADAETSTDPRVRKIFRLATPKVIPEIASPEPSPKAEQPPTDPRSERVSDPRMRAEPKIEAILPNPSMPPPVIDPWINQKMVAKDPVLSAVLNNINYQMPPSLLGPGPMGYPPGGGLLGHSPFQNPFFGGVPPPEFDKRGFPGRGRGMNRGGNWNNNRGRGGGNRRGFQPNRRGGGNRGGRSRTPP